MAVRMIEFHDEVLRHDEDGWDTGSTLRCCCCSYHCCCSHSDTIACCGCCNPCLCVPWFCCFPCSLVCFAARRKGANPCPCSPSCCGREEDDWEGAPEY